MVPRELYELGIATTHEAIPIKIAINER